MANISINPMLTTGPSGAFLLSTQGFMAGVALDDPGLRYQLEGGAISASQSTPLYGGLAVELLVPAPGAEVMGPTILSASSSGTVNAWTVFNQSSNGILVPGGNVPLYQAGMSLNFVRVGSGLRVVLPVKAADMNTIAGGATNVQLYWDPVNLYLTVTSASNYTVSGQLLALSATSKTITYSSGTGLANWVNPGNVAVVRV